MNQLTWIIKEAKRLRKKYPKRFKTWKEYVSQASAIYHSKHKRKVGSTLFLESGETKKSPRSYIRRERTKKGLFKKAKKISGSKRRMGAFEILEKGETKRNKPRVFRIKRNKAGEFSGTKRIGMIGNKVYEIKYRENGKTHCSYAFNREAAIKYAKKLSLEGETVHIFEPK